MTDYDILKVKDKIDIDGLKINEVRSFELDHERIFPRDKLVFLHGPNGKSIGDGYVLDFFTHSDQTIVTYSVNTLY